jgi:uncharacterized protein (TIGR02118 family)
MIKVSVLYPNDEGKRFDMDYYCNTHIPMAREKLGAACKKIEVDQGLGGAGPGVPAPYIAVAHLQFESMDDFGTAFLPAEADFKADGPNYTDIVPVIQISEVKL